MIKNGIQLNHNKKNYLKSKIKIWGDDNFEKYPWRFTKNKWHALAAEIMLQRTRAGQVLDTYLSFVENYETPEDFIKQSHGEVFKNLGLHWREKILVDLAKSLKNIDVPSEKSELIKLPGVGEYIAGAYRSFHLDQYDYIIDSNIVRVYGRYFGFETDGETRRKKVFINLVKLCTPKRKTRIFNYGILDFSRKICKRALLCDKCPVNKKCSYFNKCSVIS